MVSVPKISASSRSTKIYTFKQYLSREERALEKHEFYNGKIVKRHSRTFAACAIAVNTITSLKISIRPKVLQCHICSSDLKIYIEKANISVYPDALVISEAPQFWQTREDVIINPFLLIDIVSPKTRSFDRMGKFELYKMLPSFQEYVLINAEEPFVETRFQEATDLWRMRKETDMQKTITLHSIGVTISMNEIYENITF